MQQKHENTAVLKKPKRTVCASKCWLSCQLASFEALLSLEKKPSTVQRHRGPRSLFCVLSHKNEIRQNCVISYVLSFHIGRTCPVKEFSWSRSGAIFGIAKKGHDAHPCFKKAFFVKAICQLVNIGRFLFSDLFGHLKLSFEIRTRYSRSFAICAFRGSKLILSLPNTDPTSSKSGIDLAWSISAKPVSGLSRMSRACNHFSLEGCRPIFDSCVCSFPFFLVLSPS